jgi:hypothetical protein
LSCLGSYHYCPGRHQETQRNRHQRDQSTERSAARMIVIGVLILILVLLNFLGMVDGGVPRLR